MINLCKKFNLNFLIFLLSQINLPLSTVVMVLAVSYSVHCTKGFSKKMNSNNWKLDLFSALDSASSIGMVMDVSLKAVRPFGFDFCGWRSNTCPTKRSNNTGVVAFNAVKDKALEKIANGDCDRAPVPRHCAISHAPISWRGTTDEDIFLQAPDVLEEYYSTGHYSGWAISTAVHDGQKGIFFVESQNILSPTEILYAEQHMRWVSAAAYVRMCELKQASVNQYVSIDETIILRKLYWHNASINEVLVNSGISAIKLFHMIENLCNKFGCNSVHALLAHALFLGLIA